MNDINIHRYKEEAIQAINHYGNMYEIYKPLFKIYLEMIEDYIKIEEKFEYENLSAESRELYKQIQKDLLISIEMYRDSLIVRELFH